MATAPDEQSVTAQSVAHAVPSKARQQPRAKTSREPSTAVVDGSAREIAATEKSRPRTYQRDPNGADRTPSFAVRVRHCSLEHAPYRLLVGHFQGLPLTGAESRLNERSDGRLERFMLMNQYPQRLGEMVVFEPVDKAPPQGIVVIGLGPSGELSAGALRSAVARALVRVALDELDLRLASSPPADGSPWRPLGVSSVLIGSSPGGGLPVESSVRALIDAVTSANARLARLRVRSRTGPVSATDIVWYDLLELTERYEDRVDLIVGALARIKALEDQDRAADDGAPERVTYVLSPVNGEGASSANSPIDAADEVWRRIDIHAPQRTSSSIVRIEFTSIGRLARAERLVVEVERAIVDQLLAQAIQRDDDPDISGTLYELLVPHELKGELGSAENLHLLVDKRTADWPFELLRPRSDDDDRRIPMALQVGVLRQFRETEHLRFNIRRASGNDALVIANPPTPAAPKLPGAAHEGSEAAAVLAAHGFTVDSLIWDMDGNFVGERPPESLGEESVDALHALLNGDWRVVHIAAHGEFGDDSSKTGVLLGALHLTASTFAKMSVVPDLVVLNACHLGRIGHPPNRAAASVGRSLLALGVRAAVVAGWAVDDRAATAFSSRLLHGLGDGEDFGSAVTGARRAAWKQAPNSLTWGAYQCYGDPGFSLAPGRKRADGVVHTVGELRRRTRRLASTASDQGRSARLTTETSGADIREELEGLERTAGQLEATNISADLAEVWADLLNLDQAIRLYRDALARGGSNTPVKAVEQLGNLLSRRARQRSRTGTLDDVADDQQEAELWLQRALDLGPSGERLALMGGFHKRAAAMTNGDERQDHLRKAISFYREAQRTTGSAYHELNWLQLTDIAVLNGMTIDDPAPFEAASGGPAGEAPSDDPAASTTSPVSKAETAVDFWQRAEVGNRLLTKLVEAARSSAPTGSASAQPISPDLTGDVEALADAYEEAFRLRSNPRERASVTDHLRDLVDLAPAHGPLTPLKDALARLEGWPNEPSARERPTGGHDR